MSTVYRINVGEYEDRYSLCAFTTKKRAQEVMEIIQSRLPYESLDIDELGVDPEILNRHFEFYQVRMTEDGELALGGAIKTRWSPCCLLDNWRTPHGIGFTDEGKLLIAFSDVPGLTAVEAETAAKYQFKYMMDHGTIQPLIARAKEGRRL